MEQIEKDQYIEKIRQEYREKLGFSRFRLDDACENQAELFDRWHQKWVDYISYLEKQKRELSEKRGELDSKLRKALAEGDTAITEAEFSCYKATETAIATAVENHSEMKEVQIKIAKTNKLVNTLRGAIEAFQQRKSMLQQMCQLFITGYYGDVESVRNREIDEKLSKDTKVAKTINKRRRLKTHNE